MPLEREILDAVIAGHDARVRELLAAGPALANAVGQHEKTALHEAAERDHAAIAHLLLEAGANVEAETSWGMTPLDWAGDMGSVKVGELLVARGAQLNLWAAAGLGKLDLVKSWFTAEGALKPGARVKRPVENTDGSWSEARPFEGYRELVSDAFYIAARNGHVEVADYLLQRGADINFRGFFGGTGLHWTAINGHRATVQFLMAHGADCALKDQRFDSTPEGWAREGGHEDIAELLRKAA